MFSARVVTVRDPFHPRRNRQIDQLDAPVSLGSLAPTTRQPFIILRNGQAVLRADWTQPVSQGDLISIVLLPQGGGNSSGGSQVLRIVLMIVVMIIAWEFAPALAGAFGYSGGTAVGIAQAAIGIVGTMLVNAILPPPKPLSSSSSSGSDWKSSSPTYNIAAQGNTARLDGAIPIQYGRLQVFPDFAASPYVEYAGNEQYLYQLFCIGVGEYDIESIKIEDTPIENFEEVSIEIVRPGETLDLFPAAVSTSGEVSGQEAIIGSIIGPFTANAAGTIATRIGIDVVMPRGLYYAQTSGALDPIATQFTISARQIDDVGSPIGGWFTLGVEVVSAATTTPQRYSYSYAVPDGRYEIVFERNDVKNTSTQAGHELNWAGLRTYLRQDNNFGNITLLAVKIRATNNLSSQSSRKINLICTRRLYVWTGSSWAGEYATRSIAWALADACKTIGLPDSRINLDDLLQHDATWAARGDSFDGRFDSTTSFWEALTKIAQAGRCKPYMQGGIIHFRRDEAVTLPVALYSMRNIVRNSFSLEFITPSDDTADSVKISYYDETLWKPRPVTCALPGSTSAKPAKIELFGVVRRAQAYREGLYMAAANRYRRTLIKFSTEMEGFIPSYGDLIAIQHDLPQWGQFAEVVAWDADALLLTLSEPVTFGSGAHYIGLRRRNGSLAGPYAVTAGIDAYHLHLDAALDFTPYTGADEERTQIVFGWGSTWSQLARVVAIRPRDTYTVDITCVNEDPSVHTADTGAVAPAINSSQLPATPKAPVIQGLAARSMPGTPERMLLTWQPAAGAERYLIEQSADGKSWTRTGETTAANYSATALYGSQTIVRVAAIGALRGSWASINYALSSDYMWSGDANAMWSTDSAPMWRY